MHEAQAAVTNAPPLVAPPPGPVTPPLGDSLRAVLLTLRPKQWVKNVLVVAAAGAAGALGDDEVVVRVGGACFAFCLLASSLYAINDVRDAPEDRLHPRKRHRPVAAGALNARLALGLGAILILTGLVLCAAVRPLLAVVGGGYVVLTLTYTAIWRHLLVFDIVAIAGGFVLRAVAGGVAAPVTLSRWFLAVVTCAAVFVAAGKRLGELVRTGPDAAGGRRVLTRYAEQPLRVILTASSLLALGAYCIWAFELSAVSGIPWRPLTILPVAVALARYTVLAQAGRGEAPEDVILRDPVLLASGVAWLVLFGLGVHAAG